MNIESLKKKIDKTVSEIKPRAEYSPEKEEFLKPYDDIVQSRIKAYKDFLKYGEGFEAKLESQEGKIKEGAYELADLETEERKGKKVGGELKKTIEKELGEVKAERIELISLLNKIRKAQEDIKKVNKKIDSAKDQINKLGLSGKDAKKKDGIEKKITNLEGDINEKGKEIEEIKSKYIKKKLNKAEGAIEEIENKIDSNISKLEELGDEKENDKERVKIADKTHDLGITLSDLRKKERELKESSLSDVFEEVEKQYTELKIRQGNIPDYDFLKTEAKRKGEGAEKEQERLQNLKDEFEGMQAQNITIEDLKESARKSAETLSKFYDTQGKIFEQVEGDRKIGLFGEIIAGATQVAFHSTKGIMAASILELKEDVRYSVAENIALGMYRMRSASRGFLFRKGPLSFGKGTWFIPSVEDAKKEAGKYKEPWEGKDPEKVRAEITKSFHEAMEKNIKSILKVINAPKKETPEDIDSATETVLSHSEEEESILPEELILEEPDKPKEIDIEKVKDETDLAGKVVDKIFKGMATSYEKYIKEDSKDDKGINILFKKMKEAGIKPKIFEKEGLYIKRWLKQIKKWHKEIGGMDEKEVKREMTENYWQTVIKTLGAKDLKKTGIVRDLTGHMFKGFLLTRRSEKIK